MEVTLPARSRKRARLFAATFLPGLVSLSLGACAGETVGPARLLSRAFDAGGLTLDSPGGPPIEGDSAAGSYLVGRFALDAGDYAVAAESLDKALAADPEDLDLRRQVFLLRLASGDYARAVATAAALAQADQSADEPLLLLGLDRARSGDFRAARDLLGKVGERGATALVLPILDAWAAFGAGSVEAGLERLGRAPADQGLDLLRRYHRALMLELAGRPAEALPALQDLERRAGGPPLRVVQVVAQVRLALGDRAGAERTIEAALVRSPDDPQLLAARDALRRRGRVVPVRDPQTAMADALVGVGEALHEQQASAQALLLARSAAYLAPAMMDARLLVGRVLLDQGNAAAAEQALAKIPDDAPQSWAARLLRAQALRELDRTDDAVALLRAMAAERPARTDALAVLGDLFRRGERYPEAAEAYAQAVGRLGAPQPEDWRLLYAQGIALERTQRWPEAEAALKKALELEPDQPLVLNYLGYSWVDKGENLDQAKAMLHKAVDLKPEDGYIVDSLGWAYYRLGEYEKAVTYLERAAELEPGDPVLNDHLGDAYWRVGRQREARFQWQRALSFKPEPDVATQIQAKLDRGLPEAGPEPRRG